MGEEVYYGDYYVKVRKNPVCVEMNNWTSAAITAVNSAAIVTGNSWESIVKCLIEQAHIRGNMPEYKTCVTDMLRAEGFVPVKNSSTVMKFVIGHSNYMDSGKLYIVKTSYRGYFAVVPDDSGEKYVIKGHLDDGRSLVGCMTEEVWEYFPGTDNRTGVKKAVIRRNACWEGNDKLVCKNMNPDDRNIGDCVIRAMSAAYGFSWDDAIDFIAEITQYKDPTLNIVQNINIALIKLGFERHKPIERGGKPLDGWQFCDLMDHTYRDGERIFAYVGKHHCVAVLPFKEPDGSVKYKIQDTWDSTDRLIYEYWVYKKPEVRPEPKKASCSFEIGDMMEHPSYGTGTVINVSGAAGSRIAEVDFTDAGVKKISEIWFKKFADKKQ